MLNLVGRVDAHSDHIVVQRSNICKSFNLKKYAVVYKVLSNSTVLFYQEYMSDMSTMSTLFFWECYCWEDAVQF